ncbi:lytic transglycosylase domain-containing protein [Candidimonas nitroreducens]|jgi:type IV secretion system protein VirB1|uniref:Type VI secretion protein n=1 Tax=Candidimonas nitroreducens TaxID=683354 RepID=A0A225N0F4_9BURK|nr:lytic transglycosylase domain-containing protein [Candidimonas nitroreducens]OWT65530.1 type VI secretion protein [Candidimonas nitroreducens]
MIAELAALALTCAPNIHPITLDALIRHESGARRYSIGVNRKGHSLSHQPVNLKQAQQAAQSLIARGVDFDAGLGQINVRNWAWLGLDSTTVFDPCKNLAASQTVLSVCYAHALAARKDPQRALRAALSCYNTGNFSRGFVNGYVRKVLAQAGIQVPALKQLPEQAKPIIDQADHTAADAQHEGTPDGFTSHPTVDGFSPTADTNKGTDGETNPDLGADSST